jgi:hypothetical protein
LDLALEALEIAAGNGPHDYPKYSEAITAIKQALAAPVQEPPVFGPPIGVLMKMEGDETRKLYPIKQKPAPVQEPFDHQQAARTALRESMNRSVAIAKNTVPILQKRPQNCGTGYCSCVECVMEPAPVQTEAWPCLIAEADFSQNTMTLTMQCEDYKVSARQHWLSTTPPAAQRQWVGLTKEEIKSLQELAIDPVDANGWGFFNRERFAEALEASLKEHNT